MLTPEGAHATNAMNPANATASPVDRGALQGGRRRLIFVTNRGPVEYAFGADGTAQPQAGAGGVVSGLLSAARERPVSWISVAMTDADRAVAKSLDGATLAMPRELSYLAPRLVYLPEATYRQYYDGISNRLLWFAQHGLPHADIARAPQTRAAWAGYVAANRALAETVIAELDTCETAPPVMFHDYHLYLAPAMVRERVPEARLAHFVHIPWPSVERWADVPEEMVRAIYRGLAAVDVLGFQTARDVHNFLDGAAHFLPGVFISRDPDELRWRGRRTLVRAYPIAVTPSEVRAAADTPAARGQLRPLRERLGLDLGRKLIVRVDRVEPTKNIVRGFAAYEQLLAAHAEWRGRVVFLALLVPSRESVGEYQAYAEDVERSVARVNARFGDDGWQPIVALYGNDRGRALACMRDYDVLLVNSLADGMNLVVKEGGLVNRRDGGIVLSERAGAYAQLHRGVLGVRPTDIEATAGALVRALEMSPEERGLRAQQVRDVLEREDASTWLGRQLADLMRVTGFPTMSAPFAPNALSHADLAPPRASYLVPDALAARGATKLAFGAAGPAIRLSRSPRETIPLDDVTFPTGSDVEDLDSASMG
jgi:trehalose 6-phosphate synthase